MLQLLSEPEVICGDTSVRYQPSAHHVSSSPAHGGVSDKILSFGFQSSLVSHVPQLFINRGSAIVKDIVGNKLFPGLPEVVEEGVVFRRVVPIGPAYDLSLMHVVHTNLPDSCNGLSILHISDTHYTNSSTDSTVALHQSCKEKLERTVASFLKKPRADLAVFSGDLIDGVPEAVNQKTESAFRAISLGDVKLAVFGNHDDKYKDGRVCVASLLESCGYVVLKNQRVVLRAPEGEVQIYGFDDFNSGYAADVAALRPARFTIVIAHDLDVFPGEIPPIVDFTLSGHLHAGKINFPGVISGLDVLTALGASSGKHHYGSNWRVHKSGVQTCIHPGSAVERRFMCARPGLLLTRIWNKSGYQSYKARDS